MTALETFSVKLDGGDWRLISTALKAGAMRLEALRHIEESAELRNLHGYIAGNASGTTTGSVVAISLSADAAATIRGVMEQQAAALSSSGLFTPAARLDFLAGELIRVAS